MSLIDVIAGADDLGTCDSLFVAPHQHEALLSCPARLLGDAQRGRTVVLSLFDGEEEVPLPAGAGIVRARAVLPPAPARHTHYGTYRSLALASHPDDEAWLRRAADLLREVGARTKARDVYVPLGVRAHVEHRLCHEAALRAFETGADRNVFLYEERPESLVPGAVRMRLAHVGAWLPPAAAHAADDTTLARFLLRFHVPPSMRGDLKGWGERLRSTSVATEQWRRARAWQPLKALGPRLQPVVHVPEPELMASVRDLQATALRPASSAPARTRSRIGALATAYARRLGAPEHAERFWLLLPARHPDAHLAPGGAEESLSA